MSGLQVQLRSSSPIRLEAEFDCGAGELVALVGPSGSGKTSMLRAIAGLVDARRSARPHPGGGRGMVGHGSWACS